MSMDKLRKQFRDAFLHSADSLEQLLERVPDPTFVIDPKGNIIAGPIENKEEIIYADIDLELITASKRMFDVAGHYARPDVFNFEVNQRLAE